MKKFASLFALVLTVALTGHAHAQDKMGGKMSGGKMAPTKMAATKVPTQSFTGTVKGAPNGKMFTLSMKKGPMSVDATKAKVRVNGKFAKLETVKDGSMVTVVGKMSGTTFMADTVTSKTTPAKTAPTKMSPTTKMAPTAKPKM